MGAAHSAAPPSPAVPGEWKPLVDEKAAHPADYELPKVFEALHVPRLLASFHVIAFHFPISTPWAASICGWGKVWVGFFMMLSGFGAAHSRLVASNLAAIAAEGPVLPSLRTIARRLASLYPTFLVSLLLVLLGRGLAYGDDTFSHNGTIATDNGPVYGDGKTVLEFFLVRSWLPVVFSGPPAMLNKPDWFISALAFCWLFEPAFIRLAAALCSYAGRGNIPWLAIGSLLVYLLACPLTTFP